MTEVLHTRCDSVYGVYHPQTDPSIISEHFEGVKLKALDILNYSSLAEWVSEIKPEWVFHLAGQSHVPSSWSDPRGTFEINVFGALNVLEACSGFRNKPKILFVSSGDVYGDTSKAKDAVTEDFPIHPLNPYSASKAAMEWMVKVQSASKRVHIVCIRPFNHIGPYQSPAFVASDFARQLALIEMGDQKPIMKTGNLDVVKNFTDVRDVVNAYILALEKCPSGEVYNLASDKSLTIRRLLEILMSLSAVTPKVITEKSKLRGAQSSAGKISSQRFRKVTGWRPTIPIEQTLKDILDYWRSEVAKQKVKTK